MARKYTAIPGLAFAVLLLGQACSRAPKDLPVKDSAPLVPGGSAPASAPQGTREAKEPGKSTRVQAQPAIRVLALDKFIGERPLDRKAAEDYTLGPLADLSGLSGAGGESAAGAARDFLEGLCEGRLTAEAPGFRDILAFLLQDLLSGPQRVTRWRLGRAARRPEGGYSFPVMLEAGTGRARGEVFVAYSAQTGWAVDLVSVDTSAFQVSASEGQGVFDPTIRTVKSTER